MSAPGGKNPHVRPVPGLPPRPVLNLKRRKALAAMAAAAEAAAKRPPRALGRLIAAGVLCAVAVGIMAVLAVVSAEQTGALPAATGGSADQAVERGDGWFEKVEAAVPAGVQPGHREIRTGSMRINMRTVESAAPPVAAGDGKAAPPPPEVGSYPVAPALQKKAEEPGLRQPQKPGPLAE